MNKYTVKMNFKYFFRTMKDLFLVMPVEIITTVLVKLLIAGASLLEVYILAAFLDRVSKCMNAAKVDQKCFWYGGLFIALLIVPVLLEQIVYYVNSIYVADKNSVFMERISEKTVKANLIRQYDPEWHDALHLARECIKNKGLIVYFNSVMDILPVIFRLIGVTMVAASFSICFVPIALLSIVPSAWAKWYSNKEIYIMRHRQAPKERRKAYLWKLLSTQQGVKELRTYGAMDFVRQKWIKERDDCLNTEYRVSMKSMNHFMMADALKSVGLSAGIIFSVYLAYKGIVSVGQFSACIVAFSSLQVAGEQLIKLVTDQGQKAGRAEDYYRFMNFADDIEEEDMSSEQEIETVSLHQVSFSYPKTKNEAVKDVELTVDSGQLIVIVGENGSGKTTISKVMAGVFRPTRGRVTVNESEDNASHTLIEKTTIVQQEFERYPFTIRQNVGIADADKMSDDDAIREAMEKADAKNLLDKTEEGLDSQAGLEFGGVEFSGGEWQRLAIARGLYKTADLFIFDEPTSAVDVYKENELLKKIVQVSRKKRTVVISHRVGICKYADMILVMKDGCIVEKGRHDELLKKNGMYSYLWKEQAKWYVDSN